MGIATGAGVIISQYYGAGDEQKLSWAVHTCIALSLIGGVALSILGVLASPLILKWMGTPEDVMEGSVVYLRIFFSGSLFNLLYNMTAGVLRAVGDSRRPLYYLAVSSAVNVVLDLVFVVGFQMGIAGAAWATIIAQAVSALLALVALMRTQDIYRVDLKKLKIDVRMMKRILAIGIPSGIQQSIISLSNVIVQSNINIYGSAAMAGYGASSKIDGFVTLPLQSFCIAATTFTGQNIGAKKKKRVIQGIFQGIAISLIYTLILSPILLWRSEDVLRIFGSDPAVLEYGKISMTILIPLYSVLSIHQILMGTLRGAGKTMVTMMIGLGNMCVLRMIYINGIVPFFHSFEAVMLCYPITWFSTMVMDILYCWKGKWLPENLSEGEEKK